ncbi:hypothetical protein GCM10025777_58950 [Membranihabitans marinus]
MKCEGEKQYSQVGTCPICHMDLQKINTENAISLEDNSILPTSIFNLSSSWTTQDKETITLKDLNGQVLVMVMIYTSCKAACPRLVADMRNIFDKVSRDDVKYIFVSIDPSTDTPERLKAFAIENQMDNEQWLFLRGNEDDVRELANVLAVKYKQIAPLDFSHSNIISVIDPSGLLVYQQEGLGANSNSIQQVVDKINDLFL